MRVWLKQTGLPLAATFAFIALSFIATLWTRQRGLLRGLEFQAYDRMFARRALESPEQSPCIIVGVTEDDILRFGHPMSDRTMADLLEKLIAGDPAAVAIDIYRDVPHFDSNSSATSAQEGLDRLRNVLKENPQIILPHFIGGPTKRVINGRAEMTFPKRIDIEPSLRSVLAPSQIGFVDTAPDSDEVVRVATLAEVDPDHQEQSCNSLPYFAALNYLGFQMPPRTLTLSQVQTQGLLKVDDVSVKLHGPMDGAYSAGAAEAKDEASGYQLPMDCGGPRSFQMLSVSEVLATNFDVRRFKDRVVFIGTTNESVKDYFRTPMYAREFGVAVHARVADQLIRIANSRNAIVQVPSELAEQSSLAALCVFGGLLGWIVRSYWRFFLIVALVEVALVAGAVSGAKSGWWLPIVPSAIGFLVSAGSVTVYRSYRERLDRLAMMQLFERSVSGPVAKAIWDDRIHIFENGRLRSVEQCATVLFTDLEGFSGVAENLKPQALIDWLNRYFDRISDLVCKWGGNINKFNGDQIVAVFGPPLQRTADQVIADARGAVSCAVEMREQLRELNAELRRDGQRTIGMRVGIHTGTLVAGSLGSRERQEWTVIGDTVNIASRLESFDKHLMPDDIAANRCRILVSRSTYERLIYDHVAARRVGEFELTGRKEKTEVWGVIDYVHTDAPQAAHTAATISDSQKRINQPCIVKT